MMKLIVCEGANELAIIDMLLDDDKLIVSRTDLLGMVAYHARQINTSAPVKTALSFYHEPVEIWRIGDGMTDKFKIPPAYASQIDGVIKYCTKPELEVLLIISENLWKEYLKVKSTKKPKDFAKENIVYNKKRYNNSTAFFKDYYKNRIPLLVDAIRTYKRLHGSHGRDEYYLAELLKL